MNFFLFFCVRIINSKVIKKLYKIAVITVLVILTLPAGAYFLVQWPSIQTYITRHIARQVSESLNARFEVGRVDIVFFNRVILRDIYIEDQNGDILLKADRIAATIHLLNRSRREIAFNQIRLDNAVINLHTDADSVLNIRFIIDALTSDDTTSVKWDFTVNSVHLNDSRLTYRKYGYKEPYQGVNFQDIEVSGLNLLAKKIHTDGGSFHFDIGYLNLMEKSGFSLNHFASENIVSPTAINISNLQAATPGSRLDMDYFNLDFGSFDDFFDFVNLVNINGRFRPSFICSKDIAAFVPKAAGFNMEAILSGGISGKINNLKGDNINLKTYDETSLHANVTMVGLPVLSETFFLIDLKEFNSSAGDMLKVLREIDASTSDIEPNLEKLGQFSYKGKFTGFIDDFVAYGEMNSNLGTLISDLSLRPYSDNLLNFNGKLRAVSFDAGTLAGSDQVGNITFTAGLNGLISQKTGLHASLEGVIDSVFLFDYNYKNILFSGDMADKKFQGATHINDPNLNLDFSGTVDFTEEIPVFDFSATVDGARLHDLRLDNQDRGLTLSFSSSANFRGNHIDNLNGMISLENASFETDEQFFRIDNVSIKASGTKDQRQINFNSSLADVRISGNYEFSTIVTSFRQFIHNYIPSYGIQAEMVPNISGNNFSFFIHLKETSGFTGFFIPHLTISPDTKLEGIFDPTANASAIKGFASELKINNNFFENISVVSHSTDSTFNIKARMEHARAGNRVNIENVGISSLIFNDSILFEADWDNKEKISYKGNLFASVNFDKNPDRQFPLIEIDIKPSGIIIADSLWKVAPGKIFIDSSSFRLENILFGNGNQNFKIDGKLSKDPNDSLHFVFNNLDLKNLELLTPLTRFRFAGILTGGASLSDIYSNPVFKTDIDVNNLFFNDEDYGDLSILSQWNNPDRTILIHAFSDREGERIINIEGAYRPDGRGVDFAIGFEKISLSSFNGYLDAVFGNLNGHAGGAVKLGGTLREPLFNGTVLLENAFFTVDYLKTRYNFTHSIELINNNIVFNDLIVFDSNNNICRANGTVASRYFRDFSLNIYLYPDRFMALNTTERDNDLYYGRVIASGLVHIDGPVNDIRMNISAHTNRNTQFFIPLQKSGEIGDISFLSFRKPQSDDDPKVQKMPEVKLLGMQLNFDLDVTPDAEVQIIFDSKIGDIIRGRGNGSFKMEINTQGQFNMFGEYTIEYGDYLFTLQNVINKRFDIERGSRISWNGDPFDANVSLRADYRLRTSLKALFEPYGEAEDYTRRIPVECQIIMRNKLMTPDITFAIDVPTTDADTRSKVKGILNNEDIRNRQFLSLLIINNFLPEQSAMTGPGMGATIGMSATEASMTTVSDFFSNQLSNWLSQLSRDFDLGVNWRPGDEITPDEVELALSTQMFNDRVSINGHVDVGGRQTNTSNIVGDFDVDIKLNRSGKLRVKAFTRANDNLIRQHLSPYTQGVGLFYREEFDNFEELMNRYWNRIFPSGNNMDEIPEADESLTGF